MFISFEEARKVETDARLVMTWRNDPDTLRMSFHGRPKEWESFWNEYCDNYFCYSDLPPLFALYEGERIGFLRFRPYAGSGFPEKTIDISINLAPGYRGKGFGSAVLERISRRMFSDKAPAIVAEIKRSNHRSIRAFERAGYLFHEAGTHVVEDTGEEVPVYRFVREGGKEYSADKGKQESVFVIAEAGSNWCMGQPTRDLAMAKVLIESAAEAGAGAVKFQTYRPETVYVKNAGEAEYLAEAGVRKPITEIFRDLSMPYEMIPELADYCAQCEIEFMSTPFSIADAEAVDPFVQRHKLASYEISHPFLLEWLAKTGKPLILSSGGANLEEIDWALAHFSKNGGKNVTLLQCTAKYPAPFSSLNLRSIPFMRDYFVIPVGLSDHSRDPLIGPLGAVALGARVIEKHFTLHNGLPGPDHRHAVTAEELKRMVQAIREMEQAQGSESKMVQEEEGELREFAMRGLQAIRTIQKGEKLELRVNMDILRPGQQRRGLHPRHLADVEGRCAARGIPAGDGIGEGDYA